MDTIKDEYIENRVFAELEIGEAASTAYCFVEHHLTGITKTAKPVVLQTGC